MKVCPTDYAAGTLPSVIWAARIRKFHLAQFYPSLHGRFGLLHAEPDLP